MSGILRLSGPVQVAQGDVAPGQQLISIPFDYKTKAILTKDVTGYSFTVRGVQAPAGSPGYLVGRFGVGRLNGIGNDSGSNYDMWCFLPAIVGGKRDHICLLRSGAGIAAIAPTGKNPYLWYSFSPMTGTFDYVHAPEFKVQDVELPMRLSLDYRFDGWHSAGAEVTEMAGGEKVRDFIVPLDQEGAANILTFAGKLRILPSATTAKAARAEWIAAE